MLSSLFLLSATTQFLFHISSGYLLGEGPDDPLFQRCWQNGNLLAKCPEGIKIAWNFSDTERWIDGTQYDLEMNISWTDAFEAHVVHWQDQQRFPHINVHSCKFELGKVCIPFIKADGISVSHTSVIKAEDEGLFDSHVLLTKGAWNVIAHARVYLNDTDFYPLEGDTACTSHSGSPDPFPWKLDIAIGQSHDVEENIIDLTTNVEGWKVFMFVFGLLAAFGIFYKSYKKCKKNRMEDIERLSPEKQLRKSLAFEVVTLIISYGLGLFDMVTDVLSLVDIQSNADLSAMIVVLYFALIIVVSVFFAIVTFRTVQSFMVIVQEFQNGLIDLTADSFNDKAENAENDEENADEANTEIQVQMNNLVKKGDINQQMTKIGRAIGGEKMSLLMCLMEDVPMMVFNSFLIFHFGYRSDTIFVSFVINALMLGYKVSGIERLWLNMQLKRKLDQMCGAVKFTRQATKVKDPETIYKKLIEVGKELTAL